MNKEINCPKCRKPLSDKQFNTRGMTKCPSCETPIHVDAFPARFQSATPGSTGETLFTDDEASCFYHSQKKAVVHCHQCGRFLCALCDLELNGQHFCAACLESGKKKGKIKTLENHRTLYDSLALQLALYPLLIFYLTLLSAPATIFVAIKYWNAPTSILPRSKIRFIAAILFAVIELAGWGFGIWAFFTYLLK